MSQRESRGLKAALALVAVSVLTAACGSSSSNKASTTTVGGSTTTSGASATTAAGGGTATGEPIVIGNVASYTFPGLSLSSPGSAPIKAWAAWVNAHGGINGHPVKLFVMDDQGNQAVAVSDVKQLVEQDHVVALVSTQDAPLYLGYRGYLDQKKVPVLGGNVYTPEWVSDPMLYPQGGTQQAQTLAPITFIKTLGLKKVGIIGCSGAVQCNEEVSGMKQVATSAGLQFAYGANPSNTASDYTANCLAAQAAGAQILDLGIASSDEGNKIADDCARQNYKPDWIIPGNAIGPGYLSAKFNNAFNFSLTQPWYSTAAVMDDFHAAMSQYTKINFKTVEEPGTATDAWASGLMLQRAVELSGVTGVPTSADILAGLQKFNNETIGGFIAPVTFSDPTSKIGNCFFVTEIQNAQFVQGNNGKPLCNAA